MANICSFNMCVVGDKKNIEDFYKAISQNGNLWMGRGAEAEIEYDGDLAYIDGWCKWSIQSALIDNAISMRTNPDRWHWGEGERERLEFITLIEATEKWNLIVEIYSEESGCCFQEHFIFDNGEVVCDECIDWYEYCIDDFETKEEAEEELGIEITDDEWENECFISRGGFENWEFSI